MLTPEYLNLIEFNDVVELYNKLNINIMADIISRVSQMNNITTTTKEQLKILKQTNGTDIFNKSLEETLMLNAETKKALKNLYENVAKEDMQGYKELYKYRNKPFKLSDSQYQILNEGLKQANKTLKNLTNTIAFQSKQSYVEAVDEAYMKVVSGAFDYTSAINTAVQNLANKGITLKDKAGRNVQLEVAVRRNVLTGVKETTNQINRSIEEDLGCDGYEVTAHMGARDSHAVAQGKQYAVKHNTKISQKYPLWSTVESLWYEYNCRHTYFGIILGISEPQYSNKELKELKNATVTLNGEQIPYYQATQKQRQIENNIRNTKRSVQTLEKAGEDNTTQKVKLAQLNKQYNDFCNETGLEKDYARIKVANSSKKLINNSENDIIKKKNIKSVKTINVDKSNIKEYKEKTVKQRYNELKNKDFMSLTSEEKKIVTNYRLYEFGEGDNYLQEAKLYNAKIEEKLRPRKSNYYDNKFSNKFDNAKQYTTEQSDKLTDLYKEQLNKLSQTQKDSIANYTGVDYEDINRTLRTDKKANEQLGKQIDNITEALKKSQTKENMIVHRHVEFDGLSKFTGVKEYQLKETNIEKLNDMLKGKECTDKAFVSTSIRDFKDEMREVVYDIYMPKETKGMYINELSTSYKDVEYEFLLQRETKFKIQEVFKDTDNTLRIVMEVIGNGI